MTTKEDWKFRGEHLNDVANRIEDSAHGMLKDCRVLRETATICLKEAGVVVFMPIAAQVNMMIAEHLNIDVTKIKPTDRIMDDLGADSLDMVELVMTAEEQFTLEIPDADVEHIVTVQDAFLYIRKRI